MHNKIKVESVNIKLSGKSITLTIEEARELMQQLELVFGSTILPYRIEYISIPSPSYPFTQPWTEPYTICESPFLGIGQSISGFNQMTRLS